MRYPLYFRFCHNLVSRSVYGIENPECFSGTVTIGPVGNTGNLPTAWACIGDGFADDPLHKVLGAHVFSPGVREFVVWVCLGGIGE